MAKSVNSCPVCGVNFMDENPNNNLVVHMVKMHTSQTRILIALFNSVKDWSVFMSYMKVALKTYEENRMNIILSPVDKSK